MLLYLHGIVSVVKKHSIPSNLVMNLDKAPLKYIPIMHHTMVKKSSLPVPIIGSADKRSITGTFIVTLGGQFLPMQLIYGGKTVQSLPRSKFLDSFCLSANPKHYSKTQELVKVITEIVVPYVEKQH